MPSPKPDTSRPEPPRPARTSDILLELACAFPRDRVRLHDIGELLGSRSFGFLLLIFALPSMLPVPGLSILTGIPLALVALQMMLGMPKPYLPRWLAERSIRCDDFRRVIERAAPWLRRLERVMRPRWLIVTGLWGERALGIVCFVLAVLLALPIPLGNLLPAISIALIALGLIERDGMLVTAGIAIGVASLFLIWGVLSTMVRASAAFFEHLFEG